MKRSKRKWTAATAEGRVLMRDAHRGYQNAKLDIAEAFRAARADLRAKQVASYQRLDEIAAERRAEILAGESC